MPRSFAHKKVLITGGLGFIGSNLARALVKLGADVTLLDNLIPECGGNLFNVQGLKNRLRINLGDARDLRTLRELVRGQDYLFNLAGQSSHLDSVEKPFDDLNSNCQAPLAALEACRAENPAVRIVFASTRQVYGRPRYLPVDELHPVIPIDVNGVHKHAGEHYHLLFQRIYGMKTVVLRLTNTIGPRMRIRDARQTFLGEWIRQIIAGSSFEVWGDGTQRRDFTYVDDAVNAMLLAANHDGAVGQVFNLGGERVVSLAELAAMLVAISPGAKYSLKPFPRERQRIDIGDYYADDRKGRELLGWQHQTTLPAALKRTLDFYRKHGEKYT